MGLNYTLLVDSTVFRVTYNLDQPLPDGSTQVTDELGYLKHVAWIYGAIRI